VVISSYNRIPAAGSVGIERIINVHYAPLPKYRGRANVNWAIINGEKVAGNLYSPRVPWPGRGNILFQENNPDSATTDTVCDTL